MKYLLALIIALFLTSTAYSSSSFKNIKSKAEAGDPAAQYSLALKYYIGGDVEKDGDLAREWMERSAKNGYPSAQFSHGEDLPDKNRGFKWIEKAAQNGSIDAELFLGESYRDKESPYTKINIEKSLYWLRKAAKKSNSTKSENAKFRLALMYERGDGVKRNSKNATKWMTKLIKQMSYVDVDELYRYGLESIDFQMNSGLKMIRVAAEQNHGMAQLRLANAYKWGFRANNSPEIGQFVIKQDYDEAIKWYKLAAKNGVEKAIYNLGHLYDHGAGWENNNFVVKPDGAKAIKYYRWAARMGHEASKKRLEDRNSKKMKDWDNEYDHAYTSMTSHNLELNKFWAKISRSKRGNKRIYFTIRSEKELCSAKDIDKDSGRSIWEFNGQAIHMITFCDEPYGIEATPATNNGDKFIVNAFKESIDPIAVEGSRYSFEFSAIGFSKIWEDMSNEPL